MYQFPSLNKIGKLPCIELAAPNLAEKYARWFREAEGIPRCIPPLYQDFVIRHTAVYPDGPSRSYVEIIHYRDDLTQLEVCHIMDGKKILTAESNYSDYYDLMVHVAVRAPASSPWDASWLKNEGLAAVFCVLATQAFILYHKPDLIPVELPEPNGKRKSPKIQSAPPSETHVKDAVRQYIKLTSADDAPAQRNYRAIQWKVRGHYRHLEHADGTKYVIYIKPHLAKRGNKPNNPKVFEVEATPKKEED